MVNVLTIGSFDLLHPGHLELIAGCRYLVGPEGKVWVGVNTDDFIERYKGHKPAQTLDQRVAMLSALRDVDAVFVNVGDEAAALLIDCVRPDALAIGDDWLDDSHDERRYFRQLGVTREWMLERGLHVNYIPRTTGLSSTGLRSNGGLTPAMTAYYAEQDAGRLE